MPRRLLLLLLLLLPPHRVAAEGAAADGFSLETLMGIMARAPARRAAFTETRRFAALDGTLESRGHLSYTPGHLEKITDWPQPERLEIDGDRIVITAGNDAPRVVELGMAPALRVFIDAIRGPLSGDLASLQHTFHCVVTGGPDGWRLTLVPRDGTQLLRSVQIEGHGDMVGRIAVVQANGDTQVMVITPA
jgi:hypothetical protein